MIRRSRGFTLIELLVVIAIIAILAAILFPVFARAREKANQSSCMSNQKQIGIGILMYVQDYDETFPGFKMHFGARDSELRGDGWYESIEPYTRNEQVSICPTSRYTNSYGRTDLPNATGFWGRSITASYGAPSRDSTTRDSGIVGMTVWNYYASPLVILAQITRPAETIMLIESTSNWTQQLSAYGYDRDTLEPLVLEEDGKCGAQWFRHNLTMNCLYVDGHVKAVPHPIQPWAFEIDK